MGLGSVRRRARNWHDTQPRSFTQDLLEPVAMTALGAFVVAQVDGICWMTLLTAQWAPDFDMLTDLTPGPSKRLKRRM